mmetsp:Transcript_124535/g.278482  ORF Transcript_124535/g.278482 Transcript_124535/m.278482 type:complete len:237 (-) Transcript_124535:9-719(-)
MVQDRIAAGALSEDRDVTAIAPEGRYMVPYPLQRQPLILQAVIARAPVGRSRCERLRAEESKDVDPVIESDNDDGLLGRTEHRPWRICVRIAVVEGATIKPDHHRHLRVPTKPGGARGDVQIKAILRFAHGQRPETGAAIALRFPRALPRAVRLRGPPAKVAHRGLCVRDTREEGHIAGALGDSALELTKTRYRHGWRRASCKCYRGPYQESSSTRAQGRHSYGTANGPWPCAPKP